MIGAVAKTKLIQKLSMDPVRRPCGVVNLHIAIAISSLLLHTINALFQMLLLEKRRANVSGHSYKAGAPNDS